jgi:peroxiredoxin
VAAVRDHRDQLGDSEVVVITFTRPRNLAGYRRRFAHPLTVLADEHRRTYRAYGLGRGPVWRVYGLGTIRRYARLLARGHRLEKPHEDTLQLGGDFVVGRDGRLVYAFSSKGPDDRPPVEELVAAVRRA